VDRRIAACQEVVRGVLEQMSRREDRAAELRVALAGPPNVGKSSLFNALVRRFGQAGAAPALVCSTPGTTRDYLVARLEFSGCLCELVDTAGDIDDVEALTQIERASGVAADRQRRGADLVLECVAAASPHELHLRRKPQQILRVITKADLVPRQMAQQLASQARADVVTSARDGTGLETLMRRIDEAAIEAGDASGTAVAATAARCRTSLATALQYLTDARDLAAGGCSEELVALELREALHQIGLVVGAVYTDDILDRVFSRFCIGK
jgi:tRNA modification GTPase